MKTLTVIDTFGFFFRNYYALPHLRSKKGFPTGLLTGFINFIGQLAKEHGTDYLVFALDSKEKSIRKEIDPNYKANRPEPPEELKRQLPVAIEWIRKMGFKQIEIPGYEADDIIGSLAEYAKKRGIKVQIVSHDKDLYQLIDDERITIYDPVKKMEIDEERCREKFGVEPRQIVDYLALVGDASDNIPGVRGIGPKGASKLLRQFGTLENIYANLEKIDNPRVRKLLEEGKKNAFLSKRLATLHDHILPPEDLESFRFPDYNPILKIADDLIEMDMTAILKRAGADFDNGKKKPRLTFNPVLLDTKTKVMEVIDTLKPGSIVAFDTETDSLESRKAKIVGYSFATTEETAYYVPINHNYLGVGMQLSMTEAKETLQRLLSHKIVGQNLKYDLAVVENNFQITDIHIHGDTMILSWLLDPAQSAGLDNMARRHFEHEMVKFKDTVKKGENFSHVHLDEATLYAAEDAWMTLKLYRFLTPLLDERLKREAKEVEYPFIKTLLHMEAQGIMIDRLFFEKLLEEANLKIASLTQEIYRLTGNEFNINSTRQLGEVLFEKLGLKAGKKTKTGYSTNEQVLQSLRASHPVVPKLLEYREIYKLRSTYIQPLLNLSKKDPKSRIYTSFLQTGTATGRLSSKNPNLQNIPVRTELGRRIREGFVAPEGSLLVGIDYSQIELRLLAHFSEDEALMEAFREGKDIHMETAIKIFGEAEAKAKRHIAKSINFGLIYGMGSRKLAETIGVSPKEAKRYIESYFASFPTVRNYLEKIRASAKADGYVQTLLGRRRYFDYENANGMQLAAFERESVNTLFQGSAADLIKLAMNAIDAKIDYRDEKMLLQIHDELIFEVKKERAESFADETKALMEGIYPLRVPLKCSVAIDRSWGGLK